MPLETITVFSDKFYTTKPKCLLLDTYYESINYHKLFKGYCVTALYIKICLSCITTLFLGMILSEIYTQVHTDVSIRISHFLDNYNRKNLK